MTQSNGMAISGDQLPRPETTTAYPAHDPAGDSVPRTRRRCNLFLSKGTTSRGAQELAGVLRQRLLIAALITATGFIVFFVRNLLSQERFLGLEGWNLVLHGVAAALLVLVATVLGSHVPLSVTKLRALELFLFGVMAAYFAWLQMGIYRGGIILHEWAQPAHEGDFLRIVNASTSLRWFSLIVIYGIFVPNTWKRAALFTGILAALPLVLTVVVCFPCVVMGAHMGQSLADMATLLAVASAIALFGSYKLSTLQQEAVQARRLGQYQLKEKLGVGGMGEVYLGEHMMLRRACAIKLIRPDHLDRTSISRFEREVKAMAQLTHWNTVEVYDYGLAEDGTFYYVMEYLPGMSLQDMVERHGPLPAARVVHFLRQVCDALREAHGVGLIHRDVKPSNVLATQRGGVHDVAKLLDFGLVQSLGLNSDVRLTQHGTVLGSPPYMAPEQAMGKEKVDARSDIYSVGALAYFLLTGQPAFVRDTPMQILMAHVYERVTPPTEVRADVPNDLEEVILRCLHKDPRERFPDAESLEQALAQCECAGQWSRRDAADWWQMHDSPDKTLAVAAAG